MKHRIKHFMPPILLELWRKEFRYGWFGDFRDWESVQKKCHGYEDPQVLEKVKASMLKVKQGEVAYERDSVTFEKKQYSWPVLAALLWIASKNDHCLSVLDFGGSLGSSYYQNFEFVKELRMLQWSIVEQEHFVKCGWDYFQTENLHFYLDLKTCIQEKNPHVVLLSSVLPYLEHPYGLLTELFQYPLNNILIDRTFVLSEASDRLTIQKVLPQVYNVSYPAWFLSEAKLLDLFEKNNYQLIADFDVANEDRLTVKRPYQSAKQKGYLFQKNGP
ncbi:methyltransferase, TIGR04325 family [Deltaproteobacteria bacterium TL4]